MNLHGFQFAYEIYPSREDDSNIQILLEIKNDRCFLLYHNRNNHSTIDITDSIDRFCKGLLMMNINEWHQKCFDTPWDLFPSFFWKLSISADDIYVVCKGIDNFPENWDEFKLLLREAGITDPEFPFQ